MRLQQVAAGAVLDNGEQRFKVRGIQIINPLHVEDLRQALTLSSIERIS